MKNWEIISPSGNTVRVEADQHVVLPGGTLLFLKGEYEIAKFFKHGEWHIIREVK